MRATKCAKLLAYYIFGSKLVDRFRQKEAKPVKSLTMAANNVGQQSSSSSAISHTMAPPPWRKIPRAKLVAARAKQSMSASFYQPHTTFADIE